MRTTVTSVHLVMTLFSSLLLLLLLFIPATLGRAGSSPMVGGWTQIQNLNDPDVREIAQFAIAQHNKQLRSEGKTLLVLSKIVRGEIQVVEGFNYRLTFDAVYASDRAAGRYKAVVWDKPGKRSRQLTSFKSVKF